MGYAYINSSAGQIREGVEHAIVFGTTVDSGRAPVEFCTFSVGGASYKYEWEWNYGAWAFIRKTEGGTQTTEWSDAHAGDRLGGLFLFHSGDHYYIQVVQSSILTPETWDPNDTERYWTNSTTIEVTDAIHTDGRDWDDQPETEDNPGNMFPSGGAAAELDDFKSTDIIGTGWLDDIEALNPYNEDSTHPGTFFPGMFTPYILTDGQIKDLGKLFWADATNDFLTRLSARLNGRIDPNGAGIVSCFSMPISFNNAPTAGSITIAICGADVTDGHGTNALGFHMSKRYVRTNIGTKIVREVWGTAKDYTDTTVQIYLPYVGVKELDVHHVIGRALNLNVTVDWWTGDILYVLTVSNFSGAGDEYIGSQYYRQEGPIYRWSGNCASQVPFSIANKEGIQNALTGIVSGVGSAGSGLAMAGLAAAGAATGGAALIAGAAVSGAATVAGAVQNYSQQAAKGAQVNSSGAVNGSTGVMDYQYPFLIISRSVPVYPNDWKAEIGAPRHQLFTLSDLTGYTLFSEIHLNDIDGITTEELTMLERQLCTEGIIL